MKKVELIKELVAIIEDQGVIDFGLSECERDQYLAILSEASRMTGVPTRVDPRSEAEFIEEIRQANINPLSP
ncbi:MAG: DUF2236 domain-containing protein [Gammaproteobacteria bacterium]|nr:DUF2236 domain-containing protein [Gammaproteobacteria bacterium]